MKRAEGLQFLTQCADMAGKHWAGGYAYSLEDCPTCHGTNQAGHLRTFSRYGSTSADCAPVAWRLAYLWSRESGEPISEDLLDNAMSLVVNDSDNVAYIVREYGYRHYI